MPADTSWNLYRNGVLVDYKGSVINKAYISDTIQPYPSTYKYKFDTIGSYVLKVKINASNGYDTSSYSFVVIETPQYVLGTVMHDETCGALVIQLENDQSKIIPWGDNLNFAAGDKIAFSYVVRNQDFGNCSSLSIYSPCSVPRAKIYSYGGVLPDRIAKNKSLLNITINPNPTTDKISIVTNDKTIKRVELLDLTGKTVTRNQFNASTQNVDLSLSNFAVGVYFVKIYFSDNSSVIKKIVKE